MMTVYELWGGESSGGKILVYVNDFLKICTTPRNQFNDIPVNLPLLYGRRR